MNKLFLLITILLVCCMSPNTKSNGITDQIRISEKFGYEGMAIVYQFYQKFGFTDICEHARFIIKIDSTYPALANVGQFSISDVEKIQRFSNKIDSIGQNSISPIYRYRVDFQEIELDHNVFIDSAYKNITISVESYEIKQKHGFDMVQVIDYTNNLLYVEIHKCDE